MGTDSMLPIVLSYASGFSYEDRKINITGTFLLASIASKARKELLIEHQFIPQAQESTLNYLSRRESRVVSSDGTYARAFAALQAVVSLGFLNNIF
jgi:hypothetical protein